MFMTLRAALAATALGLAGCQVPGGSELWRATSPTSSLITGDITFVPDRVTFANGRSLRLEPAGPLPAFRDGRRLVRADLYRVVDSANPVLRGGARLCAGQPGHVPTYLVVWRPPPSGRERDPRAMAVFSGNRRPAALDDPGSCGTYFYDAARRRG